jgi:hypothetical protein
LRFPFLGIPAEIASAPTILAAAAAGSSAATRRTGRGDGHMATSRGRSEAGRKGAEALKERHERQGLTEAERRQREEAAASRRR